VQGMPTLISSCLASVEYDFDSGTMYLTFRNRRSYTLRGVPEHHYYGLLNSSSPGHYFNAYLKGRY
jgi:KTSC domain